MNTVKMFAHGTEERNNLEKAAEILTAQNEYGRKYYVGETYFDFGQRWMWTTIMYENEDWGSVQALCPRDQELIVNGNIEDGVKNTLKGWC